MALSNGSKFTGGPLIFLSPRSRDKDKQKVDPHFEIARVGEDGKIAKTGETAKEVKGDLIKIDFKEREFNGSMTKHVILYIRDDNVSSEEGSSSSETYSLDLTYRLASRSLFNSIVGLETFDNLAISYYETKRGFDAFYLRQNGNKTEWKFKLEELPEVRKVRLNGKDHSDYNDVDEFFENELRHVAAKLGGNKTTAPESATANLENAEPPAKTSTVKPTTSTVPKTAPKPASKTTAKPAPVEATAAAAENLDEDVPF